MNILRELLESKGIKSNNIKNYRVQRLLEASEEIDKIYISITDEIYLDEHDKYINSTWIMEAIQEELESNEDLKDIIFDLILHGIILNGYEAY